MTDDKISRCDDGSRTGILAIIQYKPDEWVDSLRTLQTVPTSISRSVCVACVDLPGAKKFLSTDGVEILNEWTLSSAAERILIEHKEFDTLLVLLAPVDVPSNLLENALKCLRADPRTATVSFLSNAAGAFSFPYRNTPTPYPIKGLDATGVTNALRHHAPYTACIPVCMPAGNAILINRAAWGVLGGFDQDLDARPRESIAEFALRGSRRGFQHRLDPSTYIISQWSSDFPGEEPTEQLEARHRLQVRDPSFPSVYDHERNSPLSPLGLALDVARAKVDGLRVLIDAACLGPLEMGTQVQTMAVIEALAAHNDVASVAIAVPNGELPAYAKHLIASSKIRIHDYNNMMFDGVEYADILHRPYQPDRPIPWDRWRLLAKRVIVTIQDLIAYRIGAYHRDGNDWLAYRNQIYDAITHVDAVVAISEDTKSSIVDERMGISSECIYVVRNGGDHLNGLSGEKIPAAILEHAQVASSFVLVLGTTYAHKNRDLAIRVWQELRRRGHKLILVMAGASVVLGSSRREEALVRREWHDDGLITLPDVSSEERTWLLRHAALVLYPTMAEGFGLVPFEAAALGTPTAFVGFGPLKEMLNADWLPEDWSVTGLADFSERILTDRQFAGRITEFINSKSSPLTWAGTAAGLLEAYRTVLASAPNFKPPAEPDVQPCLDRR